jgi:hypothetical protein
VAEGEDRVGHRARGQAGAEQAPRAAGLPAGGGEADQHDDEQQQVADEAAERGADDQRVAVGVRAHGHEDRAGERGEGEAGEDAVDRQPGRERADAVAEQQRERAVGQQEHAQVERVGQPVEAELPRDVAGDPEREPARQQRPAGAVAADLDRACRDEPHRSGLDRDVERVQPQCHVRHEGCEQGGERDAKCHRPVFRDVRARTE